MTDTIKVTMPVDEAEGYLKTHPNSKYIAPALEKAKGRQVPFPARLEDLDSYPRGTVLLYTRTFKKVGSTHAYPWTKDGNGDWMSLASFNDIKAMFSNSHGGLTVIFLGYEKPNTEITFNVPVEEARKIGGCVLTPLVKKWDDEHTSPVKKMLQDMKPGQTARSGHFDSLFKVNSSTYVRLGDEGTIVGERSLDQVLSIFGSFDIDTWKVI